MTGAELYLPLSRLSVCIVLGRWNQLEKIRLATPEEDINWAWREAVLQTHLFAGFPRLVHAFGVLESAGGMGQPEREELEAEDQPIVGSEHFERIYGGHAPAVRKTLKGYHPDFATWIEQHAYGRVLMRPGLSPRVRELLAVACLIALDQPHQLMSHARGALHCGAKLDDLKLVHASLRDLVGDEIAERAGKLIQRITSMIDNEAS